jgi:hypothetical protein
MYELYQYEYRYRYRLYTTDYGKLMMRASASTVNRLLVLVNTMKNSDSDRCLMLIVHSA